MNSIREMRKKAGLSQCELAHMTGVTQGAVSQWENGLAFPNRKILPLVAEILNTTTDDLLRNYPDKETA